MVNEMEEYVNLSSLRIGESGIIALEQQNEKNPDDSMSLRLLDLGFCDGEKVRCVMESLSQRGPKAYLIKGSVIVLRASDSAKIMVMLASEKETAAITRRAYEN